MALASTYTWAYKPTHSRPNWCCLGSQKSINGIISQKLVSKSHEPASRVNREPGKPVAGYDGLLSTNCPKGPKYANIGYLGVHIWNRNYGLWKTL